MKKQEKESKSHSFCETPNEKCAMNYCDENGCQNRKRELVELKEETLEKTITPKEKAKALVEQFYFDYDRAKECALIVVGEIIKETNQHFSKTIYQHGRTFYWQEVKQEIENL